jgi:hypothetical protein
VVWAMPSPWVAVEAGTDLLARARQMQRSWDRLLGEGALGPELPPQATAGMRPMIVESWRRVLATGLEPIDVLPSIEADPSETRERWLEHPLGLLRHVLVEPLQLLAVESNSVGAWMRWPGRPAGRPGRSAAGVRTSLMGAVRASRPGRRRSRIVGWRRRSARSVSWRWRPTSCAAWSRRWAAALGRRGAERL